MTLDGGGGEGEDTGERWGERRETIPAFSVAAATAGERDAAVEGPATEWEE